MGEIRSAYLVTGSDAAKIAATRARLRARAEAESGAAGLEAFEAGDGRAGPDADALVAAIAAIPLTQGRRYLLADGVERWRAAEVEKVAAALGRLAPETTVVLVSRGKAAAKLSAAVEACGGEVLAYEAPRERDLPRQLVADARARGFRLDGAAARMLVERLGARPLRLARELDRLALWAEGDGVGPGDVAAMTADTSEAVAWALSDAVIERDAERAVATAERLLAQGENVTGLVYMVAGQLRRAAQALAGLEAGRSRKQVESELELRPWVARRLFARLDATSVERIRAATAALADLEVWCRGGADYGDELALTLALRRAAA